MSSKIEQTTVRVELGLRSYNIIIGNGVIENAGVHIKQVATPSRIIIVTDENVALHWLKKLIQSLENENFSILVRILAPGEQTKSMDQIHSLVNWMLDHDIDRKSVVVALGGGVIGDLAGFAAAITLRGLPYIQIPTSLLAQVDSSVGGKTGVDSYHGKNLIGAFHQPKLVLADIESLSTLPKRQMVSGYAEIVKYGLINDPSFFEWCEKNGSEVLDGDLEKARHAVEKSCYAKAAIVAQDEYERDNRALLNLGHTFGHAFEAQTGFNDLLLHGEAVALGIVCAFELSLQFGYCSGQEIERIRKHFIKMGLPTSLGSIAKPDWTPNALLAHMEKDKKSEYGKMTLILTHGIGLASIHREISKDNVHRYLSTILPKQD